jgi:RHS repeat-associated protein
VRNGNRTFDTNAFRGTSNRSYSHSPEDHVLTAGADTYQFDADGFLTARITSAGTTTFTYSARGELLGATLPDGKVISYDHDPVGRRIAKRVNGTIIEKYLWQNQTRLLAVYGGSNNLIMRFTYADGRMPVSMAKDGVTYYLFIDQLGSLRAIVDGNGQIIKELVYDSFGYLYNESNLSFTIPFGFAGGLHDRDTGLIRFGLRDYDPAIGRWTAKDPIDFAGGDVNLFGYVGNNPINRIDPFGLAATLYYNRDTGILTGGNSAGNTITMTVGDNGISITPGDPYGTNGPVAPGLYNINPRPSDLNHPGRPTLSNPGQDWNTVVSPDGTMRSGVQIHPGTRSNGCLLTDPNTNDYDTLLNFINPEYNNGGVQLIITNY